MRKKRDFILFFGGKGMVEEDGSAFLKANAD